MEQSQYLYALPVILIIVALRMWRGSKARPLRVERMWIVPLVFVAVIGLALWAAPPPTTSLTLAILIVAAVLGLGVGWFRGRMVRITVNTETHQLTSQQSPLGMMIFLALFVARSALRLFLIQHEAEWHLPAAALTDGFLIFFGGMIIGMRLEMWIRAQRLLAEAIAARAKGQTVPGQVTEESAP